MESIKTIHEVKEMLKSKIFSGHYLERRLINKHIGYRDVVLVSPAEFELKKVFLEARQKLLYAFPKTHCIGIVDSETLGFSLGVSLLTEIDNQPFGTYRFQISNINFRDSEIIVILKCLRHITDSSLEVAPIQTGWPEKLRSSVSNTSAVIESHLKLTYRAIANIKYIFTLYDLTEIITFMYALAIAFCSKSITLIKFIMALTEEIYILLKYCTPVFLGVFALVSKIIVGFYIVMVWIFKPNKPKRQRRPWSGENNCIRCHSHNMRRSKITFIESVCRYFIAICLFLIVISFK